MKNTQSATASNEMQLKPCPFCGALPEFRTSKANHRVVDTRTVLRCTNGECYLHYNSPTSWHCGDSEEHAKLRLATWWNRRGSLWRG